MGRGRAVEMGRACLGNMRERLGGEKEGAWIDHMDHSDSKGGYPQLRAHSF